MHPALPIAAVVARVFAEPTLSSCGIFSGEQTAPKGGVWGNGDILIGAHRQDLDLGLTFHQ